MLQVSEPLQNVIEIQLNRPEKRNALDGAMVAALSRQLTVSASNLALRLLILSASGPEFLFSVQILPG